MKTEGRLGRNKCPKCSPGFVEFEGAHGSSPPSLHCIICGWREWFGITIRKPAKHETTDSCRSIEPQKRIHKKAQKDLKRMMGRLT